MNHDPGAQSGDDLTAGLRELGAALRAQPLPAFDEAAARRAFRARGTAVRRPPARRLWRRAPLWASAAALVLSVITGAWMLTHDRAAERDAQALAAAPPVEQMAVFQPLLYAPSFSPSRSYSVVRVRIPLSSLALGQSAAPDAWIEADVLVGEDGLASGIRFDPEDTLVVSASR